MRVEMSVIVVDAARATETSESAPFAVTLHRRDASDVALQPARSIQKVLATVPGLWVNERGHYAMGERITVRGTGWRSAFGVRGVMVVLDGIPLTMPDGQAFADIVDPSMVRSAEIIRGPASVFWGNASGGVLFLNTQPVERGTSARLRAMGGTHGERHLLADTRFDLGVGRVSVFASRTSQKGYRDHSEGRFDRGGAHGTFPLGRATVLSVTSAVAWQDSENPGALTRAQLVENWKQADSSYIRSRSGKESFQIQSGATIDHLLPFGSLTATLFGLRRDLDNPLPFAYVEVDRLAGGGRLLFRREGFERVRWSVGADYGLQSDDRRNHRNQAGERGPEPTLDQLETVRNVAAHAFASTALLGLDMSAGVRADAIRFEMEDRLLTNGDESGSRMFSALSTTLGFSYAFRDMVFFANYATAFETPTTTELVNRPDATGGFNPDLDPEYTRGLEIGARGRPDPRVFIDIALYRSKVDNILTQFESATEDARTYYRNAGTNIHRGAEIATTVLPHPNVEVTLGYALHDLKLRSGSLRGNFLPGVPPHRAFLHPDIVLGALRLGAAMELVSKYYVDEGNDVENEGYVVIDVRAGHAGFRLGAAVVQPFMEVSNVFDVRHNTSVVVNAINRYFEPGPGRVIRGGLNLSL